MLTHKPQPKVLCLSPLTSLTLANHICFYQHERVAQLEISLTQANVSKLYTHQFGFSSLIWYELLRVGKRHRKAFTVPQQWYTSLTESETTSNLAIA